MSIHQSGSGTRETGLAALFAALAMASGAAAAHHSYAMFDMTQEFTLDGTVRNFQWTNPHIWIDIVVIDKDSGQPVNWSIEGKGPVELVHDGWHRDSVKNGDKVSLLIHPLKQGSNGGSLLKAVVNGQPVGVDRKAAAGGTSQ